MSEIGYFPKYSQKENQVTNYTLLVLKQLYTESPTLFQEFIEGLLAGEGKNINVGVSFAQQECYTCCAGKSIMDGVIKQEPFTIFVETKTSDWFYDNQLNRHIENLLNIQGQKVFLALANFDGLKNESKAFYDIKDKYKDCKDLIIKNIEFEDFLSAIKELNVKSEMLINMIAEYELFLNNSDLLPTWKYRLDVVNCAVSEDDIKKYGVYICPEAKGAYKHVRSKYFGIYGSKKVDTIAEIKGVCEVDENQNVYASWFNNDMTTREELINIVKTKNEAFPDFRPIQVFVLDNFRDGINFEKDSPGGMFGSKKYFNFDSQIRTIDDLADYIRNRPWSDCKL